MGTYFRRLKSTLKNLNEQPIYKTVIIPQYREVLYCDYTYLEEVLIIPKNLQQYRFYEAAQRALNFDYHNGTSNLQLESSGLY